MSKSNPIIHSFPVQLLFTHLRRNLALLVVWFVLISGMSGSLGKVYGMHYLFLDPEYLGQVNFWSFFIVGITFGQLTMAFHVTSYILDSHRYTFLGVVKRPFAHFSLNNSLIPFLTFVLYVALVIRFQSTDELKSAWLIFLDCAGLFSGSVFLLIVSFFYFKLTNKDLMRDVAEGVDRRLRKSGLSRERMMKKLKESQREQQRYAVSNYLDLEFRFRKTSKLARMYDKETILKIFDQNHVNSVLIGLSLIIVLVLLGGFIENPILQIPAAASSILLLTVLVILVGSVSYWFRGWGLAFVLAVFFLVNLSVKRGLVKGTHEAKGLDYSAEVSPYTLNYMREINTSDEYFQDIHDILHSLENWKAQQQEDKPKMLLLCVSGGGQRAALWTMTAMQQADSVLAGQLMPRSVLVTGASGGMIGAAYFRELYLRSLDTSLDPGDNKYLNNIAKDNLNPVIFSLLVNDAFLSFRDYEFDGKFYSKDRGYAFEHSLSKNLEDVLDKKVTDYAEPEQDGIIPTMMLAPTIANDGRKLYITSRPVSFMNIDDTDGLVDRIRGVDFLRFFQDQGAENLSYMSALRMSASFPYITPTISLPSEPRMEIMDAGIADNFGISDALRYMYVFREWIRENTSGVVMLIVRDTRPDAGIYNRPTPSILDRLTYPIASVYNNLSHIQDRNNDMRLRQAKEWLGVDLETVELIYDTYGIASDHKRASLSWHLTTREKQSIIQNIDREANQEALVRLQTLFEPAPADSFNLGN